MSLLARIRRWRRDRRLRWTRVDLMQVASVAEAIVNRAGLAPPPFAIALRD